MTNPTQEGVNNYASKQPEERQQEEGLQQHTFPTAAQERAISFADMRNIVCLCYNHHSYFKQRHGLAYWALIQKIIGPARWEWIQGRGRPEGISHEAP
jgi:hypothetical protein